MPSSLLQQTGNKQCEHNLLTACEQTCNNLLADLLQLVRFTCVDSCYISSHVFSFLIACNLMKKDNYNLLSSRVAVNFRCNVDTGRQGYIYYTVSTIFHPAN
jgi:hypothetical protein